MCICLLIIESMLGKITLIDIKKSLRNAFICKIVFPFINDEGFLWTFKIK